MERGSEIENRDSISDIGREIFSSLSHLPTPKAQLAFYPACMKDKLALVCTYSLPFI